MAAASNGVGIDLPEMGTHVAQQVPSTGLTYEWYPDCLRLRVCDGHMAKALVSMTSWMVTWNLKGFVETFPEVRSLCDGKPRDDAVQGVGWYEFDKLGPESPF